MGRESEAEDDRKQFRRGPAAMRRGCVTTMRVSGPFPFRIASSRHGRSRNKIRLAESLRDKFDA